MGEDRELGEREVEIEGEISLHALIGNRSKITIKVCGSVRKGALTVLIDSGSPHSFLDNDTESHLNCSLVETTPLVVIVAVGNKTTSMVKC